MMIPTTKKQQMEEFTKTPEPENWNAQPKGYITETFETLLGTLGTPNINPSGDGKVKTGWSLHINDCHLTIYDWKDKRDTADIDHWVIRFKASETRTCLEFLKQNNIHYKID